MFAGSAVAALLGLGLGIWLTPPGQAARADSLTPGFTPALIQPTAEQMDREARLDVRPYVGRPSAARAVLTVPERDPVAPDQPQADSRRGSEQTPQALDVVDRRFTSSEADGAN